MTEAKTTVSEATLKQYIGRMTWFDLPKEGVPMSPALAIKQVIKDLQIPAKRAGYGDGYIGVETLKQIMVWKDEGYRLIFKGIYTKKENENLAVIKTKKGKTETVDMNAPLFNKATMANDMKALEVGLKFPYVQVSKGTLGDDAIYIKLSLQPREKWNNGYIQNSPNALISIDAGRKVEVYAGNLKMRAFRAKNIEEIIKKINAIKAKN